MVNRNYVADYDVTCLWRGERAVSQDMFIADLQWAALLSQRRYLGVLKDTEQDVAD